MISPQYPGTPFASYDPLATNFMTGGMGYLPDSQFLTPSEYGAFRTMPTAAGMQSHLYQQPSLMQSWLTANRGSFGILPAYSINTYNPSVNQLRHILMARRRVEDAKTTAAATMSDVGLSMGIGTAVGMINPFLGLAAGMMAPSMGAQVSDRIRNTRRIQNASMAKIFSGPDVSAALGAGFSRKAAAGIDESIRSEAAGDLIFKEEDYRKIMDLGLKSGLFDYSNNASQYKQVIKRLRGNFKTAMEVMETMDLGEVAKDMQRLITMGASNANMPKVQNMEAMYKRMTGLSHQDMVNTYGQQGALMFSQMGLTNYQGSLVNMASAARVEMMKRIGLISESEVARQGGVSGMSQKQTQSQGTFLQRASDMFLPYLLDDSLTKIDTGKVKEMLSGKHSLSELMTKGWDKLRDPTQLNAYRGRKAENLTNLMDILGPQGLEFLQYQFANNMRKERNFADTNEGLAAALKMINPDMSAEQAMQFSRTWRNPEYFKNVGEQMALQGHTRVRNKQEEDLQNQGPIRAMKRGFRRFKYDVFSNPIGHLVNWWNKDEDYEENLDQGVFTLSKYGVTAGLGGYSDEELAKLSREHFGEKDDTSDSSSTSKYYKMGTAGEVLFGASKDYVIAKYEGMDLALHYNKLSDDEKKKRTAYLENKFGLTHLNVARSFRNRVSSTDDLKRTNMIEGLTNAFMRSGKASTRKEAKALANKAFEDKKARSVITATVLEDNDLMDAAQAEFSKQSFKATVDSAEGLQDEEEGLLDSLDDLHTGFLGLGNQDETDDLKTFIGKSAKATRISQFYAIQEAMVNGAADEKTVKKSIRGLASDLRVSPDQVMKMLKSGTLDKKLIEKWGLSDEDIKRLQEIGVSQGKDLDRSDEVQDYSSNVDSTTHQALQYAFDSRAMSAKDTMKKVLADAGMGAYTFKEVMANPDKLDKVLEGLRGRGQEQSFALMKSIQEAKQGGQSVNKVSDLLGIKGVAGLLSGTMTKYSTEDVKSREGDTDMRSIANQINKQTPVLSKLAAVLNQLTVQLQHNQRVGVIND